MYRSFLDVWMQDERRRKEEEVRRLKARKEELELMAQRRERERV